MKRFLFLVLAASTFSFAACSSLPRPQEDPFAKAVEKEGESPISEGIVGNALESAATTFPKTKKSSSSQSPTPAPPRP